MEDHLAGDNPDFGFFFAPHHLGEPYQATANSLRDIIAHRPSVKYLELQEVWSLSDGNLVWASEGYYHDGPWVDPA